jgi:hypothetical protein
MGIIPMEKIPHPLGQDNLYGNYTNGKNPSSIRTG